VVGNGTSASCTSAAVVAAIAQGGVVTFNCGAEPVTITLNETAKVYNNKPDLVLDGGGKVTLSGGGQRRILYQNTCDASLVWMSSRCDLDDSPKTTVQNIAMVEGDASAQTYGRSDVYGGGAIFARGGRLSIVNSRFMRNRCDLVGPDVGGGAVRVSGMSAASPVHVSQSSFGSSDNPQDANACANGGALSGLVSSYAVFNSTFHHNLATGQGANPARAGTAGGGNGGAIYMDGNRMDLSVCGSVLANNQANEGGGAIIFVSNDRTGTMTLRDSRFSRNVSGGFETQGLPGMYVEAATGYPVLTGVTFD
jgi:hypothetical protein